MTNIEKGTRGEKIAKKLLSENGIDFRDNSMGIGPDFFVKNGPIIDAKYASKRIVTSKYKEKVHKNVIWSFNFHHHGKVQDVDFFFCILEIDRETLRYFIIPQSLTPRATLSISENQLEQGTYNRYENNFSQIKEWSNQPVNLKKERGNGMKKIINGLRYDTSNAIEVGSYDHGCYPGSGDFSHWSATLYKTPRSGRFFLHGKGGGMTRFAEHYADGMRGGGEKIQPMENDEALEWAEQYLDADCIEEHFSDLIKEA
uniref:Restriction endonuclease n=1 Tax=viral metagenome TaxID=1070528 RepID=A0A6H2A062_9ZZZZ